MTKNRSLNNSKCYYYKYLKSEKGLFDNIVDAVFILLMENSPREKNVLEQIQKYKLHSNIIIQYNIGFKNCGKILKKQQSNFDLLDANFEVFKKSQELNYNNILVLEDDFIVTSNIFKIKYLNSLRKIVSKEYFNLISLGSIYLISTKYDNHIDNPLFLAGAHAIIYNKRYFNNFINKYYYYFTQADQFNRIKEKYVTNIPLIVQPAEKTENRKNWPKIGRLAHSIQDKLLDIDWNSYKGKELIYWEKYYKIKYIQEILVLIILIVIIIFFIKKLK